MLIRLFCGHRICDLELPSHLLLFILSHSRPRGALGGPLRARSGSWSARGPLKCRDTYTCSGSIRVGCEGYVNHIVLIIGEPFTILKN